MAFFGHRPDDVNIEPEIKNGHQSDLGISVQPCSTWIPQFSHFLEVKKIPFGMGSGRCSDQLFTFASEPHFGSSAIETRFESVLVA